MDSLKIAFFCPNKPLSHPHPSGDLTIARDLHNALNHLGHECREIVACRTRWFWKSTRGWSQALPGLFEAYRKAREFEPDLWLTYHSYYKSPDIMGPFISQLRHIPYVIFQPMYSTRRRKASATRVGFTLNRMALKAASHTFTNNLNDLEALRRILRSESITYLPSGIVPEDFQRDEAAGKMIRKRFAIPDTATVIMTAARFRPGVKCESLAYLFRSLALLKTSPHEFSLLVVGDGPGEKHLRALAEELLPGRTIFTGPFARRDMVQCYSAADLFAFPGIGESLGMVYLEAQACGLPVVALDSPGFPRSWAPAGPVCSFHGTREKPWRKRSAPSWAVRKCDAGLAGKHFDTSGKSGMRGETTVSFQKNWWRSQAVLRPVVIPTSNLPFLPNAEVGCSVPGLNHPEGHLFSVYHDFNDGLQLVAVVGPDRHSPHLCNISR